MESLLLRADLFVLAAEALDASGGIHQLLLARKEWVAIGTDFNVDVALVRRTRGKRVPAGTVDAHFMVIGMDGCLHVASKPFLQRTYFSGKPVTSAIPRPVSLLASRDTLVSPALNEQMAPFQQYEVWTMKGGKWEFVASFHDFDTAYAVAKNRSTRVRLLKVTYENEVAKEQEIIAEVGNVREEP